MLSAAWIVRSQQMPIKFRWKKPALLSCLSLCAAVGLSRMPEAEQSSPHYERKNRFEWASIAALVATFAVSFSGGKSTSHKTFPNVLPYIAANTVLPSTVVTAWGFVSLWVASGLFVLTTSELTLTLCEASRR